MNKENIKKERKHYDYIEAKKYAEANGKLLKELTQEEMKMFEIQARRLSREECLMLEQLNKKSNNE